jgi:hypothetical protein
MDDFDEINLPVMFIDDQGRETDDPVQGVPVVMLHLMPFDPANPAKQVDAANIRCLIDTGGDYVYVAEKVISALNAPLAPAPNTIKINGTSDRTVHTVALASPDDRWAHPFRAVSLNLGEMHQHVGAVLGRAFLVNCRLHFDGPNKAFTLTLTLPKAGASS